MVYVKDPTHYRALQGLFLGSLFLYPFSAASHTLYLLPQVLLLALASVQIPQWAPPNAISTKAAVLGLAILTSATAFLREALANQPEFSEPIKLLINLATVSVFLFLAPVLDASSFAKWLKRFGIVWFLIIAVAYVHSHASTFQLLGMLFGPEGVTSTQLYEIAEPLSGIFLTKNIVAMYMVAVFGAFLYFRRRAQEPVTFVEKILFFVLIVSLVSRQAILVGVLLIALDSLLAKKKRIGRWAIAVIVVTLVIVGVFFAFAFNLNSQQDGATTRLELWRFFFSQWGHFAIDGLGVQGLNQSLEHLDIDNYHMFFMNQIAAYGLVHSLAFNALLLLIIWRSTPKKLRWLVIAPYWLNVLFQTYGYEYGNLFLFCIAANSWNNDFSMAPVGIQLPKTVESPL